MPAGKQGSGRSPRSVAIGRPRSPSRCRSRAPARPARPSRSPHLQPTKAVVLAEPSRRHRTHALASPFHPASLEGDAPTVSRCASSSTRAHLPPVHIVRRLLATTCAHTALFRSSAGIGRLHSRRSAQRDRCRHRGLDIGPESSQFGQRCACARLLLPPCAGTAGRAADECVHRRALVGPSTRWRSPRRQRDPGPRAARAADAIVRELRGRALDPSPIELRCARLCASEVVPQDRARIGAVPNVERGSAPPAGLVGAKPSGCLTVYPCADAPRPRRFHCAGGAKPAEFRSRVGGPRSRGCRPARCGIGRPGAGGRDADVVGAGAH
jgi:hypothetical protein